MHTLIVLGGDLPDETLLLSCSAEVDMIIAADRGLNAFRNASRLPDLLIGDMDSVDPMVLKKFETEIPEKRLPCMKDDTDGFVAVSTAIDQGADSLCLLGATGGRADHFLGNLSLLLYAQKRGVSAIILDEQVRIHLITGERNLRMKEGCTVSLIPAEPSSGVTISGFLYPLVNGTLVPEATLGISNVTTSENVSIRVEQGRVFVFEYYGMPG